MLKMVLECSTSQPSLLLYCILYHVDINKYNFIQHEYLHTVHWQHSKFWTISENASYWILLLFCYTLTQVKRARIIIIVLTIIAVILMSPKFSDLDISYITTESGERTLVVTSVYLYNEAIYAYIVTGKLPEVIVYVNKMGQGEPCRA